MKKTSKALSLFLAFLLALATSITAFAADSNSTANEIRMKIGNSIMTVNGKESLIDAEGTAPVIQNDRTLMPVRAVVEAMGGTVDWDTEGNTATLTYNDKSVKLTIASTTAYVNGIPQMLDVAPTLIGGRIMLPIRFVAESFNYQVIWQSETSTIFISSSGQQATLAFPAATQPDENKPQGISALAIYKEFKTDVLGVSQKYTGKNITTMGVVTYKGPDKFGTPSIALSSAVGEKDYVLYVMDSFDQLNEVSVGDQVVMSGNFHIFGSDDWVVIKQGVVLSKNNATATTPGVSTKALIVYFSLSGTTAEVAKTIQEKTGADIYLIEPETPYPSSQDAVGTEMEAERKNGNIRELKSNLPDISKYDFILVGGPVWSGLPSNPVQKYLSLTDFKGKKVAGFWTAYGDPANYGNVFKSMLKSADVSDGLSLINADISNKSSLNSKIDKWLNTIGFAK